MINTQQLSSGTRDFPLEDGLKEVSSSQGTILLVEDEAFVREATCQILQNAGYRVLKAHNATEAVRVFRHHGPKIELLLTDVVIPGQNGRELARDLKAIHQELKTIFISGYPENAVTKQIQEIGAFYLSKPFSLDLLLRKVRQVLGERSFDQGSFPKAKHASGIV